MTAIVLALLFTPSSAAIRVVHAPSPSQSEIVPVKMALDSLGKADRAKFWERVDAYASIDAIGQFCGKNLNLVRRTWSVVSPCIELSSLRRVRSVFLSKRATYLKGWETVHGDPEKKKLACAGLKDRLAEWTKILNAHIAEADSLCRACLFC